MESLSQQEQQLIMGVIRGLDNCPQAVTELGIDREQAGRVDVVALRQLALLDKDSLGKSLLPRLLNEQGSVVDWFSMQHAMTLAQMGENWRAAVVENRPDFDHLFDLLLEEAPVADRLGVVMARRGVEGEATLGLRARAQLFTAQQRTGDLLVSWQFRTLAALVVCGLAIGLFIDVKMNRGYRTFAIAQRVWNCTPKMLRNAICALPLQAQVACVLGVLVMSVVWGPSRRGWMFLGELFNSPSDAVNQAWSGVDQACQQRGTAMQRAASDNYSYALEYELHQSRQPFLAALDRIFSRDESNGQGNA